MRTAGKALVIHHHCFRAFFLGAFLAVSTFNNALAHKTSLTAAQITVSGREAVVELKVSAHDLAVALGIETDLITPVPREAFEERLEPLNRYLRERLSILAQNTPCSPQPPVVDFSLLSENLLLLVVYDCPERLERLKVNYLLFFDIDRTHRCLGRLILPRGEEQFLLDRSLTSFELEVVQPPNRSWTEQFRRDFAGGFMVGHRTSISKIDQGCRVTSLKL